MILTMVITVLPLLVAFVTTVTGDQRLIACPADTFVQKVDPEIGPSGALCCPKLFGQPPIRGPTETIDPPPIGRLVWPRADGLNPDGTPDMFGPNDEPYERPPKPMVTNPDGTPNLLEPYPGDGDGGNERPKRPIGEGIAIGEEPGPVGDGGYERPGPERPILKPVGEGQVDGEMDLVEVEPSTDVKEVLEACFRSCPEAKTEGTIEDGSTLEPDQTRPEYKECPCEDVGAVEFACPQVSPIITPFEDYIFCCPEGSTDRKDCLRPCIREPRGADTGARCACKDGQNPSDIDRDEASSGSRVVITLTSVALVVAIVGSVVATTQV